MANPLGFEDNLQAGQVTQYTGEDPSKSTGKYIKIEVPDFMNTGNPMGLGSYLRLGAIEDVDRAGKAPLKLTNPAPTGAPWDGSLKSDGTTPNVPQTEGPQEVVGLVTDASGNLLNPDANIDPPVAVQPFISVDPTGEDLASLVQGFADDSRNRGVPDGTAGGQPWSTGNTAEGREFGYGDGIVYPAGTSAHPDVSAPAAASKTLGSGAKPPKYSTDDYRVLESSQIHTKGGWRDHSDGNRITTTRGDKVEVIRGNYKLIVLGRQDQTKAKLAGMDISGGQSDTGGGDLTADASTDQSPYTTTFATIVEWKMLEGDTQYRTYTTTKKGSGPKVASKPQTATATVPAVTPDGRTFSLPITGSVGINETWAYVTYNFTGIGYARPLTPNSAGAKTPKPPDYTKGGPQPDPALPLPGADSAGNAYSPTPDYQILPSALTVNKSYVWDQTSETYANSTWTITAGPRVTPDASGNYSFPTTTTPAAEPYDPQTPIPVEGSGAAPMPGGPFPAAGLPQVMKPGVNVTDPSGPGAYNKVRSITTETHVEKQSTFTVAGDIHTQTGTPDDHVKNQLVTNYVDSTGTDNHFGSQTTATNADTSMANTTVGYQQAVNILGFQYNTTVAGGTLAVSMVGVAASMKATILDLAMTVSGFKQEVSNAEKNKMQTAPETTMNAAPQIGIGTIRSAIEGAVIQVNGPSGRMVLSNVHFIG